MFHESSASDHWGHYVYGLPQRDVGRLGLLLAALVGGVLYGLIAPVTAGERLVAVVEVKLTEFAIEMPKTVPPGQMTFSHM